MTGVRPGKGGRADVALCYAKTNELPKVPKRRLLAQRERHERRNAISGTHGRIRGLIRSSILDGSTLRTASSFTSIEVALSGISWPLPLHGVGATCQSSEGKRPP